MTRDPVKVLASDAATSALNAMIAGQFRHLPVLDKDNVVIGLLDVTKCLYDSLEKLESVYANTRRDAVQGLGNLCGIFTSKDLVLRVLAANLDPLTTTVARVMTPHPECVTPETPVLEALRKMHLGRYLHLPVIDSQGVIEGLVDVLKLTYTTLSQLSQIQSGDGTGSDGPVWDRFWEDASILSAEGQYVPPSQKPRPISRPNTLQRGGGGPKERKPSSSFLHDETGTIFPDESASVVAMEASRPPSGYSARAQSVLSHAHSIKEGMFAFKLRDFEAGTTHRFTASMDSVKALEELVNTKLGITVGEGEESRSRVCYLDDEDDVVVLDGDADLIEAVEIANRCGWGRLVVFSETQRGMHENKTWGKSTVAITEKDKSVSKKKSGDVGTRMVTVKEVEQMEAMVAPAIVGAGIAVVCAFLLGRAFK
ncbi:hypothetical protein BCR33DRAFT_720872 [Rhizoclosmatium globosum]|uniref:CBS-domain-containing protein n=1 Tax=Rhizoclosmatium globosum TaxID=329046 RepID=A0A1Y2BTT8_9FUNG|nr:hypothetical protein BCR33DRAFT_720872 [Rhizoclosmatium globosum]|eukprot:ORY38161.1 hypothetical protein BCR33DRAFT_720872 [Rhizoclosmatium globosum]